MQVLYVAETVKEVFNAKKVKVPDSGREEGKGSTTPASSNLPHLITEALRHLPGLPHKGRRNLAQEAIKTSHLHYITMVCCYSSVLLLTVVNL